jgi:hypothetical protein
MTDEPDNPNIRVPPPPVYLLALPYSWGCF